MKISLQSARRMAVNAQLLDGRTKFSKGKKGIAQIIENLGYVQIDTISVIERAHHHTLWTRRPEYHPDMLHELLANDRAVFEYWGRQASYLPMTDYRYYLRRMERFANHETKWDKNLRKKCRPYMIPVLERIRAEGALGSKDFKAPDDFKRGTWWNWNPYKIALELLYWQGDLMITARRKFERVYDLTERVLPDSVDITAPTPDELGQFLVRRALKAYGVAREKEIVDHIHAADKKIIAAGLRDLVESGEVVAVEIAECNHDFYGLAEQVEVAAKLRKSKPRMHFLSPFDNLIIQRDRMKWLFDFDYALECYVPAPKRKFGYFVLPILWGEDLIGRFDPKADRKTRTLIIRKLALENVKIDDTLLSALAEKFGAFAAFNDCDTVRLEAVIPSKVKKPLSAFLK